MTNDCWHFATEHWELSTERSAQDGHFQMHGLRLWCAPSTFVIILPVKIPIRAAASRDAAFSA